MKPRSRRLWIFGGLSLLFLLVGVGLLIWGIHHFGLDWTGFNAYTPPTPQYQRGKTLWDWLQLLIVPAILAVGAGVFTWWSTRTERRIADERSNQEQKIADQHYEQEQQIAQQRYERDQELALDKQREDLLQSYLDRMAELLLEKGLRSSQPETEVRKVARTRTVSTLIQLDGKRARTIFVFLKEAQLIEDTDPIISFKDTDLSGAKWSGANLSKADLSGADLSEADLSRAYLWGADLSRAYLIGTNFFKADLRVADLSGANLSKADLSGANLSGANLSWTFLVKANLSGANLSEANLSGANLSGTSLTLFDRLMARLRDPDRYRTYLASSNPAGADLSGAYLRRANLSEANLSEANLSKANLSKANLSKANLSGANLSKADLSGANLSGANLSKVQHLDDARLDKTILRNIEGLTPEQHADCKARGAIVDEGETTPAAPPPQSIAVTASQENRAQILPVQATISTGQTATPEAVSSQEQTGVKQEAAPSLPVSLSSPEGTPPTSQVSTTTPSSSQDVAV